MKTIKIINNFFLFYFILSGGSLIFAENILFQFKNEFADYKKNELLNLVQLPQDLKIEKWLSTSTNNDIYKDSNISLIYRLSIPVDYKIEKDEIVYQLKSFHEIRLVEIENIHKIHYTPNDPHFSEQWYLNQIHLQDALDNWDISNGESPNSNNILLAAVDVGIDWTHEDLVSNIWQNLEEDADNDGQTIECNGIINDNICSGNWIFDPDDLNGIDDDNWDGDYSTLIDDLIGWDFVGEIGIPDNNPKPQLDGDYNSGWNHGTHIAGILSAKTDNFLGISSPSFNGKIMPLKCSMESSASELSIINGFDAMLYAAKKGYYSDYKTIINASWGNNNFSQFELETISLMRENYQAIIVASAGNGINNIQINSMTYPAAYQPVISVAPLGVNDVWNHWAHFHNTVDISAPGESILSTSINNQYSIFTGSSQASPLVASGIALLSAKFPEYNSEQLIRMVLQTADSSIYEINNEQYLQNNLGKGRIDLKSALLTPLFPEFSTSINTIEVVNDFDGLASAGDTIKITLNIHNSEYWGSADSINISPYVLNSDITLTSENLFIPYLSPGQTISLIDNELTIFFSPELSSGNYYLYLSIDANQSSPGLGYHQETSIPLFIYDIIYYGDVNNDQNVDIMDVIITQEIIYGNLSENYYSLSNANLNFDDTVNILDVVLIIDKIVND